LARPTDQAPPFDHALICGLGSIGRRHLRHLRELGVARVDAMRTGRATLAGDGGGEPDETFGDLDSALAAEPGVVLVANPTALHVPTALAAARAGRHVLIEKPLGTAPEGCDELLEEVRRQGVTATVGCNLRFHPALRRVREWVTAGEPLGRPVAARAHFGAYLPDWHPWEDYRESYAARRDLGGGAALTHIHEIDYVLWMFGPAAEVRGLESLDRPLGTDVDEVSAFIVRHAGGVLSTITLSLAQRPPTRTLEVAFTGGTAKVDLIDASVTSVAADGTETAYPPPQGFDIDDTYRDQDAAFLEAAGTGGPPEVSLEDAIAALRVAVTARG
jgi:predicted dehydrogenase